MNPEQPIITGGQEPQPFWRRFLAWLGRLAWPYKALIAAGIIALLFGAWFVLFGMRQPTANNPSSGEGTAQTNTEGQGGEQKESGQNQDKKPSEGSGSQSGNTPKPSASSNGQTGNSGGTSGGSTGGTGNTGGGGTGTGGGGGSNPDPTPSGQCPAFPAFPDANCTGWQHTGVTLHDCDTTLTENNATYDSCEFDGGVVVVGTNITIKRSKITGIVSPNWDANGSLRGLTLTDVEIDGSPYFDPFGQAAIGLDNYTCIRCNVHNTGRGANLRNNVRIEDSYFHDFVYVDGAHQSAIGSNGGSGNTILHNNIQCNGVGGSGCSGAFVMYGDFDPVDDVLVQNNLFNTDGSFCTYAGSAGVASGKAYPHGTNIRYLNNRFGKKYYSSCGDAGPVAAWEANSGNVWSGNAWADGSGAVNP